MQLLLACVLILATSAGLPMLQASAFADSADGRGVGAFSRAVKAYEAGDLNEAAGAVDEAMQAGLSKELEARAVHLRAHISERSGALARALQDYSTALWMDTLPPSERKVAQDGKQRVIAAMGLNSYTPGAKQASAAPEAPPQSSSSSMWGMFDVFGSSKPAPPTPQEAPPVQAAEPAQPPATSTSASSVLTRPAQADVRPPKPAPTAKAAKTAKAPAQPPVRIAAIQPAAITSAAASANGFMIVFGSAGSEVAGRSRAQQIKASLADILVNRALEVEAGANGSYQIVAGPYKAKAAALALCSAMKQRGVSCQVTP